MPKFSVVIPLYNKKSYIKKTLESVLNQTFQDFEILVIDDGSTDGSAEIVKEVVDSRIRLIAQPNSGVSVARNTGIEQSSGEFIAFLDADDYWHQDYLETITYLTVEYPKSAIYCTGYRIILSAKTIVSSSVFPPNEVGCIDSYWETLCSKYDFVWTSATTIRKNVAFQAGLFTPGETIGEDLDFFARIARVNKAVAFTTSQCVDYNRNAENNARTRVKVAYPKAYLKVLREELNNTEHTQSETDAISLKYDKKMMAYIYTLILAGHRREARDEMQSWNPTRPRAKYKFMLRMASYLPHAMIRLVYWIRLKIF